jgi:hypothetical protein
MIFYPPLIVRRGADCSASGGKVILMVVESREICDALERTMHVVTRMDWMQQNDLHCMRHFPLKLTVLTLVESCSASNSSPQSVWRDKSLSRKATTKRDRRLGSGVFPVQSSSISDSHGNPTSYLDWTRVRWENSSRDITTLLQISEVLSYGCA